MTADGASLARTKLLMLIERLGPQRASDIADVFALAPRTVTESIDGLERQGLVRRDPDPKDRRVKRIALTDAGRAAIAASEPTRRTLIDRVFGVLEPGEREELARLVAKLGNAVAREEDGDGLASIVPCDRMRGQ